LEIIRRMRARAVAGRLEQGRAAGLIAPELETESKRILQERIYSLRIPTSRTGRPLWVRTSELMNAERAVATGIDVRLENSSRHARPRNDLGLPGHRQPRFTLSVQWQAEAAQKLRPRILALRREAQQRALNRS
jgi:hypothetical protein